MKTKIHFTVTHDRRRKRASRRNLVFPLLLSALTLTVAAHAETDTDAENDTPAVDAGVPDTAHAPVGKPAPIVCLSPGHPSYDGDKCYEAILNRKVATILKSLLLKEGYKVVMSTGDLTTDALFSPGFDNEDEANCDKLEVQTPEEKAEICNDAGADYVISIHHNYAYNPLTNYTMVFYGVDDSYNLAHKEAKQWAQTTARFLGRAMKTSGSKVYADMERLGFPLGIVANSKAPAILTEAAYYSNPKERERLNRNDYLEREARAVFDAFHTHCQSMRK